MYQSLNDFFEFESNDKVHPRTFVINECDGEGSFVINHFISNFMKENCGICMISTSQTINHYINIANKSSVNLKKFQEDNKFIQFNFIQHFATNYLENQDKLCDMQEIIKLIEQTYKQLKGNKKMIIIDDFSVFLSIGFSYLQVLRMFQSLKRKTDEEGNYLVVAIHSSERCGDEVLVMLNELRYSCDVCVSCEPLKTGYCKEVTGKIMVQKKYYEDESYKATTKRLAHYKLSDRVVSIFPIGLSGAVV